MGGARRLMVAVFNWKAHTEGSFLFIYSPKAHFGGMKAAHFSVFVPLAFGAFPAAHH